MLDLATAVTNSGSWRATLLPSIIVMRYVYDPGTDALGESILGKLQLLLYYLHDHTVGIIAYKIEPKLNNSTK